MPLYIAQFNIETSHYMGETKLGEREFRLVKGEHIDDAEEKLRRELERNDPYGVSYTLENVELFATIK
jgi:hypothetical protein